MDHSALSMSLGEAIFSQRAIRRFKPDAIALEDVHLMLEAAVKAPNGGNQQITRFLVVTDRETKREFGTLSREAWWASVVTRVTSAGTTSPPAVARPPDLPTR